MPVGSAGGDAISANKNDVKHAERIRKLVNTHRTGVFLVKLAHERREEAVILSRGVRNEVSQNVKRLGVGKLPDVSECASNISVIVAYRSFKLEEHALDIYVGALREGLAGDDVLFDAAYELLILNASVSVGVEEEEEISNVSRSTAGHELLQQLGELRLFKHTIVVRVEFVKHILESCLLFLERTVEGSNKVGCGGRAGDDSV
mmetsp:Transcript_4212/g.15477  ORF Transcript_4212/g.15477 Transcript_4212/m.15477 type:complete len:204 (-) Transcript_4212:1666-2277(-)